MVEHDGHVGKLLDKLDQLGISGNATHIIASVISPSWQDIGELAAIAVVRTFLNYFLEKDLATIGQHSWRSRRRQYVHRVAIRRQ